MPEFLEVLDAIDSEARGARAIFNVKDDGISVRSSAAMRHGRYSVLEYKKNLAAAVKLVGEVVTGRRNPAILKEVMTTDDFPLLFGDILDRQLLAHYTAWPVTWTAYAKRSVLKDFREAKLIPPVFGADGPLDIVDEVEPYPDASLSEQEPITWRLYKRGRRVPISWETLINDDLNQFTEIPRTLALAARRTEHSAVTELFVDSNGPHDSLYSDDFGNIINTTNGSLNGSNPPLSVAGIASGMNVLANMVDESGNPIMREVITLVVPPALEITAKGILNAIQIEDSTTLLGGFPDAGTNGERRMIVNNWMRDSLRLVVDPYIRTIATTNGNTTWFLFADPNYSRPALQIGFLLGHESPEIWMKSPNAVRVGGGPVSPLSGDFDHDAIEYRVRHVVGATRVDPLATVASNGTGS